jgi:hypothetical protein
MLKYTKKRELSKSQAKANTNLVRIKPSLGPIVAVTVAREGNLVIYSSIGSY